MDPFTRDKAAPEMDEAYRLSKAPRRYPRDPGDAEGDIDAIQPELVGHLFLSTFLAFASAVLRESKALQVDWCKALVTASTESPWPGRSKVEEADEKERRGVSKTLHPLIKRLWTERVLPLFRPGKRYNRRVGMFVVPKRPGIFRVVTDARAGNAALRPLCDGYQLFRLEDLLRIVWKTTEEASQASEGAYSSWTMDLRHWFYQIAISQFLAVYFAIVHLERTWLPLALPMGFHSAPAIGQSVTLLMAMMAVKLAGKVFQAGCLSSSDMPRYLVVEGGVFIFVLLDGILAVGPTEVLVPIVKAFAVVKEKLDLKVKEEEVRVFPSPPERPWVFGGVQFSTAGFRADAEVGAFPLARSSLRAWSSLGGGLLWHYRIRQGRPPIPLLEASSWAGTLAADSASGWDAQRVDPPPELREELYSLWEAARDRAWSQTFLSLPHDAAVAEAARGQRAFRCIAVDTTPSCAAFVVLRKEGRAWVAGQSGRLTLDDVPQVQAEGIALRFAAQEAERLGWLSEYIVVFGEDNDTVRHAAEKGYSMGGSLRREISAWSAVMEGSPHGAIIVRLPGDINAADSKSGDRELDPVTLQKAGECMEGRLRTRLGDIVPKSSSLRFH